MSVLSDLDPKSVFHFFEEITRIPHGSGNVGQISDYLADFARERGIFYIQDELKNIIMVKEASAGYEKEPAVILQGHMDMVAVKKPDCDIDMRTEGLRVAVDGDKVYAEGTSLGGDDGIAVAYALAILDSDTIRHPKLEVIITVDEEVGMDGARGIDLSMLTGNRMINLDSEEEGIFLTSCAGGARAGCRLGQTAGGKTADGSFDAGENKTADGSFDVRGNNIANNSFDVQERSGTICELTIGGLLGGHSGGEIHKERGNSNCLFGRLLYRIVQELRVSLISAEGGLADNAIPRETKAAILTAEDDFAALDVIVKAVEKEIRSELSTKDPTFYLKLVKKESGRVCCMSPEDTKRVAAFLIGLPNGVQAMSADMPGLVETSLNLGILKAGNESLLAEFSVRSSVESAKYALIDRLRAVTELAGGSIEITGDYPGWKFRKDSPLREKMTALYEKMYGAAPRLEAIHAGLECGILGSKIKDLDCVSIGPDMRDIHTTEETLSISSVKRVWEYLVALLEEKEQ